MSDVPSEIITEILSWLPVRSLLRFRCVSKPWRSLIDGHDFVKLHLHHSAETSSNLTVVVESAEIVYVDLDSFKRLDIGDAQFFPGYVSGSCNGLVLIVSNFSDDVYLWNPCTRKINKLPATPLPPEFLALRDFFCGNEKFALGYDSKLDDYKVVNEVWGYNGAHFCSETKIYSLNTNSWKKVEDFPYMLSPRKTWGAYLNDALHALVELEDEHSRCSDVIMAFDLVKEEHYEVPKPEFNGAGRCLDSLGVMGGYLTAVLSGKMKRSSEVWVMKEYMVKGSWCKLLCFDLPISEPRVKLCPLAYSKRGDEVLLNCGGICLNWYDLGKKTVTAACVEGLSASFNDTNDTIQDTLFGACVCVQSLVSPYSPGEVGIGKKKVRQGKKGKEAVKKKRDDFLSVGFKLKL